jgi:prevent-host-death family protein
MSLDFDATLTAEEARERFAEVLERAGRGKERILLTQGGEPLAVIVPVDDLEYLEELEDANDLHAARAAREEMARTGEKGVSLDEVLAEFGIER